MLKESKADIFVDPVLHTACALDIKHHCAAITPGRGRRKSLCPPGPCLHCRRQQVLSLGLGLVLSGNSL